MEFSIELPLNQTGLGQVGVGVAIELYERSLYPNIFIIGDPNFQYSNVPEGFLDWLKLCTDKALRKYKRDQPSIKIWHIQGSHERLTDNAKLYTVTETDTITAVEKNILSQYNRVAVPSNYSKQIFETQGLNAVHYIPNFYDGRVFSKVEAQRKGLKDVTIFGIFGKMEKRKRTAETIKAWVAKFGGDKRYRLNCHVFNHYFMQAHRIDPKFAEKAHRQAIEQQIGAELPWNVEFFSFLNKEEMNLAMNAADIHVSLSGGEGFNLPLFHGLALGKRAVALNEHAHQDYCTSENCVLVEPSGKEECYDGMFFHKEANFNQGNIFKFEQDAAIAGFEAAINRSIPDPKLGEELREKFSVQKTVDELLKF